MRTVAELVRASRPWVVAHRGYSARYPENTLCAFEAAIDAGADVVELDVGLSADRVPFVLHDATLERTTNGRGPLHAHTATELEALDAGSWFAPEFAGERLPTLQAVLERIGAQVVLDIEFRPFAFEAPAPDDALERQVHALVERLGLLGSVIVSSFEHGFLTRTRDLAVGLVYYAPPADAAARCRAHSALFCALNAAQVTHTDIRRLTHGGTRAVPYTVNDESEQRRLLDWGAGVIITDDPARLRDLLAKR